IAPRAASYLSHMARAGTTAGGAIGLRQQTRQRALAVFVTAATALVAVSTAARAEPEPCRSMEHERNSYTVCEVDLRADAIRLFWKRPDGTPYSYLSALPRTAQGERGRLLFASNAGMYDPGLKPV